ncbi:hypothetical protein E5676_scaffold500G001190 [Cucumis melo var. makuwa]|uniref:Uncharacterized protein n=1 Tax=Cucumis melo var. makuwa TaxID=1194695 RepID=A0A5A7TPM2_CUCMM|nr:hypothetical protein E6C27_scaffold30G001290 [Cucumis melo var. makuwa]TYK23607.1 hypothetical protein E5676_scaffold500G001190 [Cucumis melo var. makuwa]
MHLPHEGQHVARYTVCASHHATLGACSTLCARPCLRMSKKAKKPLELFGHALFKSVQKAWEHPRRRPNMHKGSCQTESTHAHPRRIQTHPEASMTIWKATMTVRSVMECPDCSKVNCIGVERIMDFLRTSKRRKALNNEDYYLITPRVSTTRDGVIPTHKNVGESEKYVGKGYADVFHDVGNNVGRNESGEVFPTSYQHGVRTASPDAVTCVDHSGVGSSSSNGPYADARYGVAFAFVPLVKLTLGDFYLALQFVPKLH